MTSTFRDSSANARLSAARPTAVSGLASASSTMMARGRSGPTLGFSMAGASRNVSPASLSDQMPRRLWTKAGTSGLMWIKPHSGQGSGDLAAQIANLLADFRFLGLHRDEQVAVLCYAQRPPVLVGIGRTLFDELEIGDLTLIA